MYPQELAKHDRADERGEHRVDAHEHAEEAGRDEAEGDELWSSAGGPSAARPVRGIEDWLTVITAGQAAGISSEATAARHRRPGGVYRPVRDAPPVPVWLAWWTDSPPPNLDALHQLICEQYAQRPPRGRR